MSSFLAKIRKWLRLDKPAEKPAPPPGQDTSSS
jgi:hypothetical protein